MVSDVFEGYERACPVCHKEFICRPEIWAYKRPGRVYMCSWHCLREFDRIHGTKWDQQEIIVRMVLEGKTVREIADVTGASKGRIGYWKHKLAVEEPEGPETEETDEPNFQIY